MYPFLDDSRERALAGQYSARLRESGDDGERQLLQNAYVRVQAMIGKKAQMQQRIYQQAGGCRGPRDRSPYLI